MPHQSKDRIDFNKSPTSFNEQVDLLKKRGLIISDEKYALDCLRRFGYYRLEAYALNFQEDTRNHIYKPGTYFEEVIGLYCFDRELRLLLLDAIESFEISFRTTFANFLSCAYGTPFPHLKPELFAVRRNNINVYENSLSLLEEEFKKSKEVFVSHYKQTYKEKLPPIWMCTELMTLGELSKWYNNLRSKNDKRGISSNYGLRHDTFASFLNIVTNIRNFAAHHARLWNRKMSVSIKLENLPEDIKNNANYNNNENIYNTIVFLIYCLHHIKSEVKIAQRLRWLIGHYNINADDMGFPSNWKELAYWEDSSDLIINLPSDIIRKFKLKGDDWKSLIRIGIIKNNS